MSEHLHLDLHHLRTEELARDAERRRAAADRRASADRASARRSRGDDRAGSRTWGLPASARTRSA